jgi:hypothetical protein
MHRSFALKSPIEGQKAGPSVEFSLILKATPQRFGRMLLDTIRKSLALIGTATIINRRCICSAIGILLFLVGSAHHAFAKQSDREPKRVLLLYHSLPTNLVYAKNIRAELARRMPDSLELYDAPLATGVQRKCRRPVR